LAGGAMDDEAGASFADSMIKCCECNNRVEVAKINRMFVQGDIKTLQLEK